MTSGKGANPDSSEPVIDLESQLDDLLEQIEEAEPGLISTPAPKASPNASPSSAKATPKAAAATENQTEDQADDVDFDADFQTVEAIVDPDAEPTAADDRHASDDSTDVTADISDLESLDEILSQADDTDHPPAAEPEAPATTAKQPPNKDILATIAQLQGSDDSYHNDDSDPAAAQLAAQEETPIHTAAEPETKVEVDADVEDETAQEDEDAAMFSPDDFITSEQAADAEAAAPQQPAVAVEVQASTDRDQDAQDTQEQTTDDSDDQADTDDPLGMDLASQIQQLLDDARTDNDTPGESEEVDQVNEDVDADEADDDDQMLDASFDTVAEVDAQAALEAQAQQVNAAAKPEKTVQGAQAIDPPVMPENDIPDSDDLLDTLSDIAKAVATPEPAASAALEDVHQEDDIDTQAQSPAQETQQVATDNIDDANNVDDAEKVDDADAMSLDDIDQMLADEADQAVAGDFETLSEVLEPAAAPEPQEAAIANEAQAKQNQADAQATNEISAEAEAGTDADDEEMDFAGSFETTDDIITQEPETASEQSLSEDAQAVARELDEQPENKHAATAGSINSAGAGSGGLAQRVMNLAAFARVPDVAKQVCETISRPMEAVAPQTRDMVGYIGLITLFWGTVAVMVKLIFAMNS